MDRKVVMKNLFYKKIGRENVSDDNVNFNLKKISDLIAEVKAAKSNQIKKLPRHSMLLRHYDVISLNGTDHLITSVNEKSPEFKYFCPYESLFDVIFNTHEAIDHGSRVRMIEVINSRYKNVKRNEINTFLKICPTCNRKKELKKSEIIMKNNFYDKLDGENLKENSFTLTTQKISNLIAEIKSVQSNAIKKLPRHHLLLRHYDVISLQGIDYLITPVNDKNPVFKYYCSYESLFNVLFDTHESTNHGGRDKMTKAINLQYKNIGQSEITTFLKLCEPCKKRQLATTNEITSKPITSDDIINSRCQVNIIDFQSQPDGNYKFILTYQDSLTKFTILRPLTCKDADDVSAELLDIFLCFGAPCILQSHEGREFCNSVIKKLRHSWPELNLVSGKPSLNERSVILANQEVDSMLMTWMLDNNTTKWSLGLRFVQFMKNRSLHYATDQSPYEAMFGCAVRVGLKSTNLPSSIYSKLSEEEDLERVLKMTEAEDDVSDSTKELIGTEDINKAASEISAIIETSQPKYLKLELVELQDKKRIRVQ